MTYFVLASLLLTVGVGVLTLVRWLSHRGATFPTRLIVTHVGTAVLALGCWITFMLGDRVLWAWLTLGVLTLANIVGDTILTGRFRAISGVTTSSLTDYGRAVVAVVTGKRPAAPTLHALGAGVTYFATLAAAVIAT
ncbi:hypothetical protein [Nocardioides limicola]|uniref:hypothetical protein n=1 Tax=Nocardioides limicola TaxID=2803368 RepID=UPI00193B8B6C|nr:hypothetical protein [Nocardioides sp. DJM-14]